MNARNCDYHDMLAALVAEEARYLVVGAYPCGTRIPTRHDRHRHLDRADVVAQFGLALNRIDSLTGISGLIFEDAWPNRVDEMLEDVRVPVLGLADLVANKRASGRDKDIADVKGLDGRSWSNLVTQKSLPVPSLEGS